MLPTSLELALWQTMVYAEVFDYPLTLTEAHHYLLTRATLPEVQTVLQNSAWLKTRVTFTQGYLLPIARPELLSERLHRAEHAKILWNQATWWARAMGALPFVRMVAITGALAMDNVTEHDDIDLLIITLPNRVWLTRAFAIGLVYLARLCEVSLCPNYVLANDALAQTRRDLYTAHDLVQMVPLVGQATYWQMRTANEWTTEFLPQAQAPLKSFPDFTPPQWLAQFQRLGEKILSGQIGDALENWERTRKMLKLGQQLSPHSAAQLDEAHVKGHFNDHGARVLQMYQDRIKIP